MKIEKGTEMYSGWWNGSPDPAIEYIKGMDLTSEDAKIVRRNEDELLVILKRDIEI